MNIVKWIFQKSIKKQVEREVQAILKNPYSHQSIGDLIDQQSNIRSEQILYTPLKYSNELDSEIRGIMQDQGIKLNPEIWNPLFRKIHLILKKTVKQYYAYESTDPLLKFFIEHEMIQPGFSGRSFFIVDEGLKSIGIIWFKNLLCGWRLALISDTDEENWKTRGPIESVEQIKTILDKLKIAA